MYFKCPMTEKLVKETGRKEIKNKNVLKSIAMRGK